MKYILSFCLSILMTSSFTAKAEVNSAPSHGKISFTVSVTHINEPFKDASVEVIIKGSVVARGNTNSVGTVRLELASYMHEPATIRVSSAGYTTLEMQGLNLVNNRNYPFGMIKGDGVKVITIENNVENINTQSEERVKELEAERAKAEADRKAAEEKAKAAREEAEKKQREAAEKAKETEKSLEDQRAAREREAKERADAERKRQEDLKKLEADQ
jgi:flagellar biosynthesis GTPase FlhF